MTAATAAPERDAQPPDRWRMHRRFGRWFHQAYSPRQRRWLLVILILSTAVRIGWVVYAARPPVLGDPVAYTHIGTEIARGHGYNNFALALLDRTGTHRPYPPTAFYPVGYPAALGGLFWVVFHTPIPDNLARAVGYFHVVLGVATVALAAEVARRLFDARAALITAAILAVFPNLVFYTAEAQLETLFNFLIVAALLIAVARPWGHGWQLSRGRLIAFGAVLGASALVRPNTLLFLPLAAVVWVVAKAGWRRSLTQAAWVTLAAMLVISPSLIRNAVRLGAPVFSTGAGDAFCTGHHPGASGHFELALAFCQTPYDHFPYPEREVRRNAGNTRKAFQFVLDHPQEEASLLFWRAYYGYRDDHEAILAYPERDSFLDPRWRQVLITVADAFYFGVLALGLIGLPAFATRRRPRALFFLLCLGGLAVLPLILFGDPRYHVPVLPLIAVAAAVPLSVLLERFGQRPRHTADHAVVTGSDPQE